MSEVVEGGIQDISDNRLFRTTDKVQNRHECSHIVFRGRGQKYENQEPENKLGL